MINQREKICGDRIVKRHMYVNIRLVKRRFLSEEKELIEKRQQKNKLSAEDIIIVLSNKLVSYFNRTSSFRDLTIIVILFIHH